MHVDTLLCLRLGVNRYGLAHIHDQEEVQDLGRVEVGEGALPPPGSSRPLRPLGRFLLRMVRFYRLR